MSVMESSHKVIIRPFVDPKSVYGLRESGVIPLAARGEIPNQRVIRRYRTDGYASYPKGCARGGRAVLFRSLT
jgi:hypothetical protein